MKPYSHSLPHTPWGLDLRVAVLAICMWAPLFASCMLFQRGVDDGSLFGRGQTELNTQEARALYGYNPGGMESRAPAPAVKRARAPRQTAYGSQECVATSTRELIACMSAGPR